MAEAGVLNVPTTAQVPACRGRCTERGLVHAVRSGRGRCLPAAKCAEGFSLVELVVVLIIVGILAVVAIPRLFGPTDFEALGYFDSAQAAVRYGQKVAVAQRRPVHIVVGGNTISVCYDPGCAGAVTDPTSGQALVAVAPDGVSVAGPNLAFDGLGRPSAAAVFTVSTADAVRSFAVEAETGYVHP